MLGLSLGMTLGNPALNQGVGYEAEASALFARFTTPPTAARKALINTLIKALKTAGVWTKLDALYLFAAADAQAARQNWIQDLYNATAVSAPTFTADRGYAGDAAASYVDSNFNPAAAVSPKFVRDSAYFGIWSRTDAQTGSVAGWFNGADGVTILPRSAIDQVQARINQATTIAGSSPVGTGMFGAARSAAAVNRASRNGANLITGTTASTAPVNASLRFGSITAASFNSLQFAAGLIGQNLSVAEEAAAYTPILTYMQAVGAA